MDNSRGTKKRNTPEYFELNNLFVKGRESNVGEVKQPVRSIAVSQLIYVPFLNEYFRPMFLSLFFPPPLFNEFLFFLPHKGNSIFASLSLETCDANLITAKKKRF